MHGLHVSRFLALHPELVSRVAPEPGLPCLDSVFQGFFVGVGHHEDILAGSILHYDGQEPVSLFKVDILESLGVHVIRI